MTTAMALSGTTAFLLTESIGLWSLLLVLPLAVYAGVGSAALDRILAARKAQP